MTAARPASRTRLAGLALASSILLPVLAGAAELRVCFREDDLPRAERSSESGLDVAVLRAVAAELDLELQPVWLPARPRFTEIEGTDLPLAALVRGECDVVPSVAGEAALGRYARELVLTVPYYGASFELVASGGRSFASLEALAGRTVAVRLQSLAHFAVERLGLDWRARPSTAEVLGLLDTGEADAALVWGPALAPFGRRPVSGFEPPRALRFNEHLALRREDPRREALDGALARLLAGGRIEELAAQAAMVVHRPFAGLAGSGSLRSLDSSRGDP